MNIQNSDFKLATSQYYARHPITKDISNVNRWYDILMYKELYLLHDSLSFFHKKFIYWPTSSLGPVQGFRLTQHVAVTK
jgi:hypothetical protein